MAALLNRKLMEDEAFHFDGLDGVEWQALTSLQSGQAVLSLRLALPGSIRRHTVNKDASNKQFGCIFLRD